MELEREQRANALRAQEELTNAEAQLPDRGVGTRAPDRAALQPPFAWNDPERPTEATPVYSGLGAMRPAP
jgi:hypothetical protein